MYEQQVKEIDVNQLKSTIKEMANKCMIIDAREVEAFYKGHIPGAHSLFDGELISRAKNMDKNACVIIYGPGQAMASPMKDRLAGDAARKLKKMGFKNIMALKGGLEAWAKSGNKFDTSTPGSIKIVKTTLMSD